MTRTTPEHAEPAPEFSREVPLARLRQGPVREHLEANAAERRALADRLGVLGIDSFAADVVLESEAGDVVRLEGDLKARLTQECVVTLEPFEQELAEHFVQLYVVESGVEEPGEVIVSPAEDDSPEPLVGDRMDLGEAVAQQLALAIDPHPRKPGASLDWREGGEDEAAARDNPFRVLKDLKDT